MYFRSAGGRSLLLPLTNELLQQAPLRLPERVPPQQVRPAQPGPAEALLEPPARDLGMVAAQQHGRHALSFALLGPGVLGMVQQSRGEGVLLRRILVAE